jgi:hypothetical protein
MPADGWPTAELLGALRGVGSVPPPRRPAAPAPTAAPLFPSGQR